MGWYGSLYDYNIQIELYSTTLTDKVLV